MMPKPLQRRLVATRSEPAAQEGAHLGGVAAAARPIVRIRLPRIALLVRGTQKHINATAHHTPRNRWFARLTAGGRRIRTCMGLFLSRVVLGLSSLLCSERERAFFVPSPAIRFPGARGRCQGTEMLSAA